MIKSAQTFYVILLYIIRTEGLSKIMAVLLQNEEAIFEICAVLSEQENLKVTLKEATKGALKVGFCSFVGALLGGPIGLAIGR